jgi:phosphopantothenoylcysteine synthetase/decarboxylase
MSISILNGKEVFVTAGSTRAYLDAVRYISNRSSGRLGATIAAECLRRGAYVSFFHSEGAITPKLLKHLDEVELPDDDLSRLDMIEIETVAELAGAIERELKEGYYDIAIHAMSVLDFIPDITSVLPGQTKNDLDEWDIKLVPTPKVIDMIKRISPDTLLVGFKLTVNVTPENLEKEAQELMQQSGADMVVANDLGQIKAGSFLSTLIEKDSDGLYQTGEVEGRTEVAAALCDRLEERIKAKQAGEAPGLSD